ncbi:MAG: Phosphatidyl-myo-inositol mannosyltransferase [Anaerolineales bacterium]|nr:Phosphatidyl-myo-inositol mannosyltransferase [Anaerolineales bacterium]
MKIAQVSPYDYPYAGGVQEHIRHLSEHFQAMGHQVQILAASSATGDELQSNIVKVSEAIVPVPFSGSVVRISISPRVYWRVKRILEEGEFDIIHLHEPIVPLLPLVVLRHAKTVTVGTFHAYRDSHAAYDWGKPAIQPFIDRLDGKIVVSTAARSTVARYFPGEYVIVPNGVEYGRFADDDLAPIAEFGDSRPNILFVGRLEKRKGFKYLLEAFRFIKAAVPDARLLVVGKYDKEDVEPFEWYVKHHALEGVHFVGYATSDELPRYYQTADVCCVPSTGFESFGIVLLEAMAAGTPVVASNIPGYREVLTDGKEGRSVPPGDVDELASATIALLNDPERRRQMGCAGRRTARDYRWEVIASRVYECYEMLLAERQRRLREGEAIERRWRELAGKVSSWLDPG